MAAALVVLCCAYGARGGGPVFPASAGNGGPQDINTGAVGIDAFNSYAETANAVYADTANAVYADTENAVYADTGSGYYVEPGADANDEPDGGGVIPVEGWKPGVSADLAAKPFFDKDLFITVNYK